MHLIKNRNIAGAYANWMLNMFGQYIGGIRWCLATSSFSGESYAVRDALNIDARVNWRSLESVVSQAEIDIDPFAE